MRKLSVELRQPVELGWVGLAIALALPWLVERHAAPWTMFYPDALMAATMLALACWALVRSPARVRVTAAALGFAVFALVPLLQAAGGLLASPAEGAMGALYLAGFAFSVLIGLRCETVAPGRAADALLTGLAIAALASVGLQLYQWVGLNEFGALVLPRAANGRPSANVGQPNLLATMLVWGLIALWWAYERRRIGPTGAALGAAFLLLGIAITQSRTGWLEVGVLGCFTTLRQRMMLRRVPLAAVLLLALWFVALVLILPQWGASVGLDVTIAHADPSDAGKRPAIWQLAIDAIAARPWLGWGWGQGGEAHVALAADHVSIQILTPYFHNVALDLMLWNGIPIGALSSLAIAGWFVARWRGCGPGPQQLLLLALAALLVHSMVELPHAHALFLLPAGLMVGLVEAHSGARAILTLPRRAGGAMVLVLGAALALLFVEHRAVEHDLLALRMRAARIANLPPLGPPPRLLLMSPFGDLLTMLRLAPRSGLDEATLDWLQRVAYHFPSTGNLLRLAQTDLLNGRPTQARAALVLACQLAPPEECDSATMVWNSMRQPTLPADGAGAAAALAPERRVEQP
jgi:O-antigen ligase